MFKVGDYVVYRKDVCRVKEMKESNNEMYYILVPIDDESLTISLPTKNDDLLRYVIGKSEAEELISKIPLIDRIETDERNYENEYKKLLSDGTLESLVRIIKTAYTRNDARVQSKKKISAKDDAYFKRAERQLYSELSVSLNMSFDETKDYIISSVQSQS